MEVSKQQGVHTISKPTAVSAHICFRPSQRDYLKSRVKRRLHIEALTVLIMIALLLKVWALLTLSSHPLLNQETLQFQCNCILFC